ncbi:MAG: hypothetical protein AAF327_07280 [Cyanobacteria bacterium P01_A01_bin.37]
MYFTIFSWDAKLETLSGVFIVMAIGLGCLMLVVAGIAHHTNSARTDLRPTPQE